MQIAQDHDLAEIWPSAAEPKRRIKMNAEAGDTQMKPS
jgi:hypothetical protein